ncbi:TPA: tail fiber assembly protein [Vibrio vulnificus]
MMLSFIYNNISYEGYTVEDAKDAGVPDDVIDQAIVKIKWDKIRIRRDFLIKDTDWTQVSDVPLTEDQKAECSSYRQTLRNIPQDYSNPDDVIWPKRPAFLASS